MTAIGLNKLVLATRTWAAASKSSSGTGNVSHAFARSRRCFALSSTARRSSGFRLLSSALVTRLFPVAYELEISNHFRFFLGGQIVLGEGGDASVALGVGTLGA